MINYTGKSVGYDFGLKTFLTSSDYNDIKSPLYLTNNIKKLKKLSRNFSKKKKGSNNAKKARLRLAHLH
jgi:putative transposase